MPLKLLFREWYNFIWSCLADSGSPSCALLLLFLSLDLSTCATSVLEISLGSQMAFKIAAQISCLLHSSFNSQNEIQHLFWELTTWELFSSNFKLKPGLLSSQFDGRAALLSVKGISPLFSVLWCYTEDRRFLRSSWTCILLNMKFEAVSGGFSLTAQRSMCCPRRFTVLTLYLWSLTHTFPLSMFFFLLLN